MPMQARAGEVAVKAAEKVSTRRSTGRQAEKRKAYRAQQAGGAGTGGGRWLQAMAEKDEPAPLRRRRRRHAAMLRYAAAIRAHVAMSPNAVRCCYTRVAEKHGGERVYA